MAEGEAVDEGDVTMRMVALYDFDPSTIDWPFRRQRPLPLTTGQVIQVIHDDGSEWALGHLVGQPDSKGYFPKNYTVSVAEYHDMMRDYEENDGGRPSTEPEDAYPQPQDPPETRAIPSGPLPVPMTSEDLDMALEEYDREEPELVYPGVADYPVLEAQPPQGTTFDLTRSRLLRDMPTVPDPAPEEPAPPEDDIMAAREEVEKELAAMQDPFAMPGGQLTESRASTPATHAQTRPERDFVRKHLPMELQNRYLKQVSPVQDLVRKSVKVAWQDTVKQPYQMDMRVRSTTCRMAANIEPPHMRMALNRAAGSNAKWTQMFRPGFNDIVNESFKAGCNACILSKLYLADKEAREQFQKLHIKDVNGVLWFELQRRKDHLFYMRMDFVDVMMCHPDAWNFPDTNRKVSANPGEPINPFHGWYYQGSIDTDKEMEDVEFQYTLRVRAFPEHTFQALALGKIPEWIQPYLTLHTEAAAPEGIPEEEAAGADHGKAVEKNLLMEAGLEDGEDLYVKLDELRLARERTTGPDVLDAKTINYRVKGLSAMRIFLRGRGNPDNMKQSLISPKMVKDMAAQLGIRNEPSNYWYAMFALRYPLAPEWEAVIRNDTRFYIHLPSDRMQPVHPMIKRFREHLDDCKQNDFLWEYRGFVKMKCSECGIPDSVLWCQQCTDYFCAPCFLQSHKSGRGKKHWPMPIPGSRYLTASEAARLRDHLPLLNVGFSHRRRFLARDNQSDKNGSRNGDTWLFFHVDTFQAALVQAPEKHWFLKRLKPPRLAPGVEGYYYNFQNDFIADDASHILTKAHEQKALSLLQKNIRGAITRRRIKREVNATLVIQKTKLMWDTQKIHGANGKNAAILKSWYRKFKAKQDKAQLEERISRVQARWRGFTTRKEFFLMLRNTSRFQACFRGLMSRRRHLVLFHAIQCIQKTYRGRLYGRRPVRELHENAAKIQALGRGVALRDLNRRRIQAATRIQSHTQGLFARIKVRKMQRGALKIQTNWRRFQAQLEVKIIVYEKLEALRQKRQDIIRGKLEGAASAIIQRNWRRHRDYQDVIFLRREKGEADKRTSTMLVALMVAGSELRHFVHPWWRHLPTDIQEVLQQIKASMQRTIGLVPVTGKLANEEIGRRGLRVANASDLTYVHEGKDPDLASHMLLSVTRHLLSHIPADLFAPTVKWACYAIGHQACDLAKVQGVYPKQLIPVGKELPAHPGDSLATLWDDVATIKHHHDWLLTLPNESLPCLILSRLPSHHRHVYLTAEVLVTMRQALNSPQLSTDDHLKFQGLDASAGAQLMEVLGSEMDHKLPLDWPKVHGTVAALAAQMSTHISEMKPERGAIEAEAKKVPEKPAPTPKAEAKTPKAEAKGKAKASAKKTPKDTITPKATEAVEKVKEVVPEKVVVLPEPSVLSFFNRNATMRLMQQVGYFMRDQDKLLNAVLGQGDDGQGVRQSRYISVTDKLFEMADRATHDHCSFVLAVVLFHMVLRGLQLRVLYHRAAISLQKRYRYLKTRSKQQKSVAPTICIQRYWRGLRTGLRIMRQDDAAEKIQHSYKAWKWNRRAAKLLAATLKVQRVWHSAVHRKWLRECHQSATTIQRCMRGMLVRVTLDKPGRELVRKHQVEMNAVIKKKNTMTESMYISRTAVLAAKARVAMHKHRDRNVELRRMGASTLKSKQAKALDKAKRIKLKGSIQPVRISVFEPMAYALARLDTKQVARYGAQQSKVLLQVSDARRKLERAIPKAQSFKPHAAAKRGRAAITARRLFKKPKASQSVPEDLVDNYGFDQWLTTQFAVKR